MWRLLFLLAPALGFQLNREPPPPAASSRGSFDTRWLDVRLNHFDATNTDTFPMRFFFNPREANASNIVIFVGGEWEITPGWVTGGLAYNIAEYTDASLFYTEHRYYGLTRPTNGTSVPELRFLTIDQALADLAQFITYVKSDAFEQGRFRNAKVMLVGCSYAGTMATWMRVQYPHLIDGSFSDSGPLHAQEDFPEYLKVVGDAISSQGGQSCYTTIEEAVSEVTEMLNSTGGRNQVTQIFNTCTLLFLERNENKIVELLKNEIRTLIQKEIQDSMSKLNSEVTQRLETPKGESCIDLLFTNNKSYSISVSHEVLLTKLYGVGIRGDAHEWLRSYLSNREQCVQLQFFDECTSELQSVRSNRETTNCSDATDLFVAQKKCLRIIVNIKPRVSCKPHFVQNVLTLKSIYVHVYLIILILSVAVPCRVYIVLY
ncbi:hypothetical protein ABMA28_017187 [Loxostege sticticalis]|uniref:Serine protease K12H4.7 n=1 Tax=Loxostege sticticalis TaxID=481309 RepID=A0ABD0S636_LOXSC